MRDDRVSWRESVLVGVFVFGLIGTASVVGILVGVVNYLRTDTGLSEMLSPAIVASAALAATIVGTLMWRMVVRSLQARRRQGAIAGLLTGILAHPLCWILWAIFVLAQGSVFPGGGLSPFAIFYLFFWMTFVSLALLGWISVPLGALLGAIVLDSRSWRSRKSVAVGREPMPPESTADHTAAGDLIPPPDLDAPRSVERRSP